MTLSEIVVEATLYPDGTLHLDRKPELSPGRVTVVLKRASDPIQPQAENWWDWLETVCAEREASGNPFMNEVQMQDYIEWLREDDDRIDLIHREMARAKRLEEKL